MRPLPSPIDLPVRRITHLFPFPVEGLDVTDLWADSPADLGRLGLTLASRQAKDIDPRVDFTGGPYFPVVYTYSTLDGGWWIVVPGRDDDWILAELPLTESDYAEGDPVFRKTGGPYFGTVTGLGRPIQYVMVKWDKNPNGSTAWPINAIALRNDFNRPPPQADAPK